MTNKPIGLRIPQDLLNQIEAVRGDRTLTQTIVDLLQRGLGIEPGDENTAIVERLEVLEKKVLVLEETIVEQRKTPVIQDVKQDVRQRKTPVERGKGKWQALVQEHPGASLAELTAVGREREPGMDPKIVRDSIRRAMRT